MRTKMFGCAIALAVAVAAMQSPASAQTSQQAGLFLGEWCGGGSTASVTMNGSYVTITNLKGASSPGYTQGGGTPLIVSNKWKMQGKLNPAGHIINWDDGTQWARCFSGAVPNVGGTWQSSGGGTATIDQRGQSLYIKSSGGQSASGSFTGKTALIALWDGKTITGTLSQNRKSISWSNGFTWTR